MCAEKKDNREKCRQGRMGAEGNVWEPGEEMLSETRWRKARGERSAAGDRQASGESEVGHSLQPDPTCIPSRLG